MSGLKHEGLSSALGMALLIGGCPHRQAARRVVYVPSPPSTATAPSIPPTTAATGTVTETLVIQEPEAPGQAPAVRPEEEPAAPTPPRPHRRPAPVAPNSAVEPAPEPAEVPTLEPRESPQQQVALRGKIQGLQQDLARRITQLERASLSATDRKTLEDARTFLAQSGQALEEGDLQRSWMLAHKASLLLDALDRGR